MEGEDPRVDLRRSCQVECKPIDKDQKLGTNGRQNIGLEEEAGRGIGPIWFVAFTDWLMNVMIFKF